MTYSLRPVLKHVTKLRSIYLSALLKFKHKCRYRNFCWTIKMPRKCCVPGCHSNYSTQSSYKSCFLFPKDKDRQQQWLSAINRKDFTPGSSAVICIDHFDKRFIIHEDKIPQKDGSIITIPRKKVSLTDDAYPTNFPNQPHYLTKELPKQRKSPSKRKDELLKRDEAKFLEWCKADEIKTLNDLKSSLGSKLTNVWNTKTQDDSIFIYKVELFDSPQVTVALQIYDDLTVNLYYKNEKLNSDSILGFILGNNYKVDRLTKFDSVISFLNLFKGNDLTVSQKVHSISFALSEISEIESDDVDATKLKFIAHQLLLASTKQLRYTPEMILWATKMYFSYPAAYLLIRKSGVLTLPHQSYLRNLTGSLVFNSEVEYTNKHFQYLKHKAKYLQDHEKIVNILLDEIYIHPSMDYKGGNVVGVADNCPESVIASTVQSFMISSVFSKNKDIAALIPVKNLKTDELHGYTLKVMDMLNDCGYTILSIISDNNRINRNMFVAMCNGNLTSFINSPYDESKKIFFLFDTPHLIKSVRNNWLNQNSTNQTFFYPDLSDTNKINIASLAHIKTIYDLEKNSNIKTAPKLTRKVLFPSSVEKQNVNHALGLFHDTTIVSLEQHSSNFSNDFLQTKCFIQHFQRWWNVVNSKHPYKGKCTRNNYCDLVSNVDHPNILFLQQFCNWLARWKDLADLSSTHKTRLSIPHKGGMLSNETQFALMHTTKTLIEVSKYLLQNGAHYILLGKFQTDSLETCFGQFRQMNGGNYNISYRQVIESDKKLKILNLLKLNSKLVGCFSIKLLDCSQVDGSEVSDSNDYEEFYDAVDLADTVDISQATMSVLIFIAGYVALKVQNGIVCTECILVLSTTNVLECDFDPEVINYMKLIDRGGLKWPNKFTIDVVLNVYRIFEILISGNYEGKFLKNGNLKSILMKLTMEKIFISNCISINMCSCGISTDVLVKKCISIMANILINNYCKVKNDKIDKKSSKRKLSTLLASTSK